MSTSNTRIINMNNILKLVLWTSRIFPRFLSLIVRLRVHEMLPKYTPSLFPRFSWKEKLALAIFPYGITVSSLLPLPPSLHTPRFPPRNSPLSSVANETKIKCKWKFIAPGDRRCFRTFKYFINFPLLRPGPAGSPGIAQESRGDARTEKGYGQVERLRNGMSSPPFSCRFFTSLLRGATVICILYIVMLLKLLNGYGLPAELRPSSSPDLLLPPPFESCISLFKASIGSSMGTLLNNSSWGVKELPLWNENSLSL